MHDLSDVGLRKVCESSTTKKHDLLYSAHVFALGQRCSHLPAREARLIVRRYCQSKGLTTYVNCNVKLAPGFALHACIFISAMAEEARHN